MDENNMGRKIPPFLPSEPVVARADTRKRSANGEHGGANPMHSADDLDPCRLVNVVVGSEPEEKGI
ncbi:hypothetical protein RvY_08371 [Ramazzottius varieornatus]|uniref:Uncharacterized protein n=1 Tax=Ramazzottius varieornatus TaxID=947166 RepID=A0A1D1VB83_RAMVA|nr:hypothetical protein RvY_08371 [Ramazzottius varieornatus]